MPKLDVINLDRDWGTVILDRLPNDAEFEALNLVLRGIDDLLAGREPGEEFTERILKHPDIQRRLLELEPAGKIV